jgi:cation diffusion facilitator family transporter
MDSGSRRAILAAFLANLGIALAKFLGFLLTGASSMLAEAIHSVADTANQGLLMLGGAQARRPPSPDHPFGHARARYFWAFVVALVLFTLGGLFAVYEGVEKLRHPHGIVNPLLAIGILIVGLGLEWFSLRTAVRAALPWRGGRSWWRYIRRSKNPELPVVLLEDTGALLGLLFALAGVGLTVLTGDPRFDALGSLAIGLLLIVIAAVLMVEMKGLLIGEGANPEVVAEIRRALASSPGVVRVLHLRTEHLGPDDLLVAAKIELPPGFPMEEVARVIDGAETRIRRDVPIARMIFLEPDVFRPHPDHGPSS